jgi:hypothetical protein
MQVGINNEAAISCLLNVTGAGFRLSGVDDCKPRTKTKKKKKKKRNV